MPQLETPSSEQKEFTPLTLEEKMRVQRALIVHMGMEPLAWIDRYSRLFRNNIAADPAWCARIRHNLEAALPGIAERLAELEADEKAA